MKVNSVSNQNFNGRICFIDHTNLAGKVEKLGETIAPIIKKNFPEMEEMIAKKPYDLFISRPDNLSEFYQVDANVRYENILSDNKAKKGISSMVYESRLDRFPVAAAEAMRSFERASAYEELIKPEGLFKGLWNMIRGIKS